MSVTLQITFEGHGMHGESTCEVKFTQSDNFGLNMHFFAPVQKQISNSKIVLTLVLVSDHC